MWVFLKTGDPPLKPSRKRSPTLRNPHIGLCPFSQKTGLPMRDVMRFCFKLFIFLYLFISFFSFLFCSALFCSVRLSVCLSFFLSFFCSFFLSFFFSFCLSVFLCGLFFHTNPSLANEPRKARRLSGLHWAELVNGAIPGGGILCNPWFLQPFAKPEQNQPTPTNTCQQ